MKKSTSLLIVLFIYIFTFFLACLFFSILPIDHFTIKIILADIFATFIIFLFSSFLKNSSIYDPYWSVAPLCIIPFFVSKLDFKNILMLILILIWGIRLTLNWAYTFRSIKHQDWRYSYFHEKSPKFWVLVNFFGIHLMPTIIVILVMLPAFEYLKTPATINLLTKFGTVVAILGILLEHFSDNTAHQFRKENPGKVNNRGLWKYSRHPNYLGEITFWWGIFLMMLSINPDGLLYLIGPLANTCLFLFISIPLMERRQLKNKPEYLAYQKETSMLLLFPKKKRKIEGLSD